MLPILCQGELIGWVDAKAHRADGVFEVKAPHVQPGAKWTAAQIEAVAQAIVLCAHWYDTPTVRITQTQRAGLRGALSRAVQVHSALVAAG